MIVIENLSEIKNMGELSIALGNFDGVHLGHQYLIREAANIAKKNNINSAVFTFSNHPRNLTAKGDKVKRILELEEKEKIIENLGIDYLISIPFNEDIMNMEPISFVKDILVDKLKAKFLICGFNYRFGKFGKGSPELLKKLGRYKGFEVLEVEPVIIDENIVSSSLVRTLIESGKVDSCKEYLGRNYKVKGTVVHGNHLGSKLGFPTSNINIKKGLIVPPNGVYITLVEYKGDIYKSITNVGNKPTIGNYEKNMETHIFDFNKELYGKEIKVEFIKKTRDEVRFQNVKELSEQIMRDCKEARKFFENFHIWR